MAQANDPNPKPKPIRITRIAYDYRNGDRRTLSVVDTARIASVIRPAVDAAVAWYYDTRHASSATADAERGAANDSIEIRAFYGGGRSGSLV